VLEKSCRVCRVFGSPWLTSRVAVKDLLLAQPEFWSERHYEVRAGVGIERDSEAAQKGILYSSQLVPPGTEFEWEIVVENAHPENEEPLVVLGLREMMRGSIPLGGGRSRGMGRISLNGLEAEEVTRENLLEYLQSGKGRKVAWETLEGRVAECLTGLAKEGKHV
ncbi:MAG: hypothetical protein HY784_05110, partial [Chloroflexi bacterium]|nr:hypothetical protein [Chloroflexota bacterium]